MRNFDQASLDYGSSNIHISSVKDPPATDMLVYSMLLLKEQQSPNIVNYAPIVRCFTQASIYKIDTSYIIEKDKLAFTKIM